jgi:L-ascorbate metabolism protein UlaG (beta-lactamase superfamily)
MKNIFFLLIAVMITTQAWSQDEYEHDVIATSDGDLNLYFINHGTLMFIFNDIVIHVDPVSRAADYNNLPKADIILVTHHHGDHLDPSVIDKISKQGTELILTQTCYEQVKKGKVMRNGESASVLGMKIEAVPAYNVIHKRDNGEPFHPKGIGNGYVVTIGNKRVYIGGDTENFPEMKEIKDIDIAFLPMNLPYTMTPEMVADAAAKIQPKLLYPYHYGQTDTKKLIDLMKSQSETEVRIREFY